MSSKHEIFLGTEAIVLGLYWLLLYLAVYLTTTTKKTLKNIQVQLLYMLSLSEPRHPLFKSTHKLEHGDDNTLGLSRGGRHFSLVIIIMKFHHSDRAQTWSSLH